MGSVVFDDRSAYYEDVDGIEPDGASEATDCSRTCRPRSQQVSHVVVTENATPPQPTQSSQLLRFRPIKTKVIVIGVIAFLGVLVVALLIVVGESAKGDKVGNDDLKMWFRRLTDEIKKIISDKDKTPSDSQKNTTIFTTRSNKEDPKSVIIFGKKGPMLTSNRIQDCGFHFDVLHRKSPGIYLIDIPRRTFSKKMLVFCHEGWTVIQSRGQYGNPPDYFYRNWTDYVTGFGQSGAEQWIGLENIYHLTNNGVDYKLRIEMWGSGPEENDPIPKIAEYDNFRLGSKAQEYKLMVSGFSSPSGPSRVGDCLGPHSGMGFATQDHGVQGTKGKWCAENHKGAWWYTSNPCHLSNLNGLNLHNEEAPFPYSTGIVWRDPFGYFHSLSRVRMMIKSVDP